MVPRVPGVPRVPRVWFQRVPRVLVLVLVLALANQGALAQKLPEGPGAEVLTRRCVVCHESDIITSQRLSLGGWTNSINKMVRWGSQITADEREVLQPYLAANFSPKAAVSHASVDTGLPTVASAQVGAATFKRACLVCHGADMVEQQKLNRTGWTRSVEKMMRWGASIADADKAPLIEYLASRFGPR